MQQINYVARGSSLIRREGRRETIVLHTFYDNETAAAVAATLNEEVPKLLRQAEAEGYQFGYNQASNYYDFDED